MQVLQVLLAFDLLYKHIFRAHFLSTSHIHTVICDMAGSAVYMPGGYPRPIPYLLIYLHDQETGNSNSASAEPGIHVVRLPHDLAREMLLNLIMQHRGSLHGWIHHEGAQDEFFCASWERDEQMALHATARGGAAS